MLNQKIEDDDVEPGSEAGNDLENDPANPRRAFSAINLNKYESLFEKEKVVTAKYSLKTAQLETGFCYHLRAVFFMRLSMYKRNIRGVLNEMFLPAALAASGILMSEIGFYEASKGKVLMP